MSKLNVAVLIILCSLTVFAFVRNTPAASKNNFTVIIDDKGFSPDHITVPVGATITWINKDSRMHWPASNPHPLHSAYPENGGCIGSQFDACHGLEPGEKYSFKFDTVGSWGAHDHLFPGSVMSIDVVDANSLPGEKSEKETFDPNKTYSATEFRALSYANQMKIIKLMANDDPSKAWKYLKETSIVENQTVGHVHEFAHVIGNIAYEKYGLSAVKICDSTFEYGCFHGVTEEMLLKEGPETEKTLESECLKFFPPDKSSVHQDYQGCIHGSGHGLLNFEGGDINKALKDCDILSLRNRTYCYGGAFMENSFSPESRVFDPNDPWKPCRTLDEAYQQKCATYHWETFLGPEPSRAKNSFETVDKYCNIAPTYILKRTCYDNLGQYIARIYLGDIATIQDGCNKVLNIDNRSICVIGAVKEVVYQKRDVPQEICENVVKGRKEACLEELKNK